MYEEAKTVVRTPFWDSKSFPVKVGVHQGSVTKSIVVHYGNGSYNEIHQRKASMGVVICG